VVAAVTERTRQPPPSGLIGLTCNEVQHLFAALAARPAGDLGHRWRWSLRRRRHRHAPAAATTDDKPPGNLCAEHRIRTAVPGIRAAHGDASATLGWLA
jgi:hypothetical protein